jgi:hypothetical protein
MRFLLLKLFYHSFIRSNGEDVTHHGKTAQGRRFQGHDPADVRPRYALGVADQVPRNFFSVRFFSSAAGYNDREEKMANAPLISVFVSVGLGIVFSMMIVKEVSKRGVKINFALLRLYIIKYIDQYQK